MPDLSYSALPQAGTPNSASDVITPLNEAKDFVNSAGWVDDARIASENNSAYKTIHRMQAGWAGSSGGAGATLIAKADGTMSFSPAVPSPAQAFYLAAADYAVSGKTTKLRVRADMFLNGLRSGASTLTFGLYPITSVGSTGAAFSDNFTVGSVVAGSAVTAVNPVASTTAAPVASADFALPTDGAYVVGVNVIGSGMTNTYCTFMGRVQVRNV